MKRILVTLAVIAAGIYGVKSIAADATPSTYFGANYVFTNSGAGTVTLPTNTDYLCIARTNISPNLTALACTNDVRTIMYFIVLNIQTAINAQPATNTFQKLTVQTYPITDAGYSNLLRRSFNQTFILQGGNIVPAGE